MWGALSVQLRIFPYSLLERSLIGISAIFYNKTERESFFLADGYNTPLFKEYIGKIGLTIEDKNNTDRYVLYSNSIDHIIRLINNDGQLIHEWNVHPTEKLQKPDYIFENISTSSIEPRDVYLYPNGDILVVYEAINQFHNNYGIAKFNKNSDLIWFKPGRNHHYIDVSPEGDIYTLSLDVISKSFSYPHLEHIHPPSFEDYIEIINEDGKLQKRISILKAISESTYSEAFLHTLYNANAKGDHLHPNTVHYVTSKQAAQNKLFKTGDLIISLRSVDTIIVIDPKTENIRWLGKGAWAGQHHTILSKEGKITLFDNLGAERLRKSRIMEFDPITSQYKVLYSGQEDHPFYAPFCSMFQLLPHKHIFITSHHNGRMFEIDAQKNIVWEYFIPIRDKNDQNKTASVYAGKRYTKSQLPFLFKGKE